MDDDEGPEIALRKLTQMFGVLSYVIMNKHGIPIKYHNMEEADALHYSVLVLELTLHTRDFLDTKHCQFEEDTELRTLRLRTNKHEIIIVPDPQYILVTVHDPNYVEPDPADEPNPDDELEPEDDERD